MLERQQLQLTNGLQELFRRVQNCSSLEQLRSEIMTPQGSDHLLHDILTVLGALQQGADDSPNSSEDCAGTPESHTEGSPPDDARVPGSSSLTAPMTQGLHVSPCLASKELDAVQIFAQAPSTCSHSATPHYTQAADDLYLEEMLVPFPNTVVPSLGPVTMCPFGLPRPPIDICAEDIVWSSGFPTMAFHNQSGDCEWCDDPCKGMTCDAYY